MSTPGFDDTSHAVYNSVELAHIVEDPFGVFREDTELALPRIPQANLYLRLLIKLLR